MPLKNYGVLKGTVLGHLRDADDDHYQILVDGKGTMFRVAVNVKSAATNAPSTVLFLSVGSLPDGLRSQLRDLKRGFKSLPSKPNGIAQDYVRGGVVDPKDLKPVPPDAPGVDNDLKDKLEAAVVKAVATAGSVIYACGERWGPEKKKRDQYFRFQPGNGVHDIHMNQGNTGKWKKDNGVFQDGALIFEYPNDKWLAFFFAFQSQTFDTDDQGNARGAGSPPKKKEPKKKSKKKGGKKGGKKKPAKKK